MISSKSKSAPFANSEFFFAPSFSEAALATELHLSSSISFLELLSACQGYVRFYLEYIESLPIHAPVSRV